MLTRNGTDTVIGFIPGADIDEGTGASKGGLAKCPPALKSLNGWSGTPALGSYTYPSGGASENWDFQRAQGAVGPVSYRAFAIPNGYTIADVRAGKCDAIWTARAQNMVADGQGQGYYFAGYEGADKNFNGSAGQVVPSGTIGAVQAVSGWVLGAANWAYAVSRQVSVMRKVAGWDPWIGLNYDVDQAMSMGLDPDPFRLVTVAYQSIDTECYPIDDFKGGWSASTDETSLLRYTAYRMTLQLAMARKHGVPLGIGEMGPMLRTDSHASGDDPAFIQWLHDFIMANDVAHAWLYNGTTGDTSRVFLWDQASGTYKVDTAKFPKSAAAIKALFDPALFLNKSSFTQAQLDAAVASATTDLTMRLNTAVATNTALAAQVSTLNTSLNGATSALAASEQKVGTYAQTISDAKAYIAAL